MRGYTIYMPESAEEYYDKLHERDQQRVWWRMVLKYCAALVAFLMLVGFTLGAYWTWEDSSAAGFQNITWQNYMGHARFRWSELMQGRIGLD
jgi:hypothetical protein